jgi:hypothetical protein
VSCDKPVASIRDVAAMVEAIESQGRAKRVTIISFQEFVDAP